MIVLRARSMSLAVMTLLDRPERDGVGLGHDYVDFGGYVVALTRPGGPRMPNGIETEAHVARGARCSIGGGRLDAGDTVVLAGPGWDPVPRPRVILRTDSVLVPDPLVFGGRGDGLTPAGDDLLAGYAAGLVLFHGRRAEAFAIADVAARRTTALSATLLRHAGRGELPEPAHALLEDGDPGPLLRFGHTSGRAVLFGLALAAQRTTPAGDFGGAPAAVA